MSLFGDILGGILGFESARYQTNTSRDMAREQMQFQERMSGTAFQRARADLEKAGLNPILAASSPASSPQGAMGQVANYSEAISKGVSAAQQVASFKKNMDQVEATTEKLIEEKGMTAGQTANLVADTMTKSETAKQEAIKTKMLEHQYNLTYGHGTGKDVKAIYDSLGGGTPGAVGAMWQRMKQGVNSGREAYENIKRYFKQKNNVDALEKQIQLRNKKKKVPVKYRDSTDDVVREAIKLIESGQIDSGRLLPGSR